MVIHYQTGNKKTIKNHTTCFFFITIMIIKKWGRELKMTPYSLWYGNKKIRHEKSIIKNMVLYYHKPHFIRTFLPSKNLVRNNTILNILSIFITKKIIIFNII